MEIVTRRQCRKQREAGSPQLALNSSVREGPALRAGGARIARHDEPPWDGIHAPGGARRRSIADASPASDGNRDSRLRARSNAVGWNPMGGSRARQPGVERGLAGNALASARSVPRRARRTPGSVADGDTIIRARRKRGAQSRAQWSV